MVEREPEHAVELLDRLLSPDREGAEQHLGVAGRPEAMPRGGEPGPDRLEVVDLPVEHQAVAGRLVQHRLMTQRREVHDRQPAESEPHHGTGVGVSDRELLVALIVGAAMHHRPHHAPNRGLDRHRGKTEDACDAAHGRPENR